MTAYNDAANIAVFGSSVAILGLITRAAGGMVTGAVMKNNQESMLPYVLPQDSLEQRITRSIDQIHNAIDETNKTASIKRIERILGTGDMERFIVGAEDLCEAITDYRAITRGGLAPEEFQEEKDAAFEAVTDAVDGLDIDEEALEEYLPLSIPRPDLREIADKYGWWAARLAESVCPHKDIACVEREAKRFNESSARRKKWPKSN
ncbi:hypothetical protein ACFLXC_07110 [Chloroflexota bacterium]